MLHSFYKSTGLSTCIFLTLLCLGSVTSRSRNYMQRLNESITIQINTRRAIHVTDERYLSVGLDDGVLRHHWETFNFSSKRVQNLAAALAPAYLRFGGTDAEWLIFDPLASRKKKPRKNFTMTASDWDDLNNFAAATGLQLLFDFNAFLRRGHDWDPTNAIEILRYSIKKNYTSHLAFELGNEPNDYRGYNMTLSPRQSGRDILLLHSILQKNFDKVFSTAVLVGPDVTRPERSQHFLTEYLSTIKSRFPLTAITWHQYYLNGRLAKWEDFLDPSKLELLRTEITTMWNVLEKVGLRYVQMWLGETSSAFGGGAKNLSDRFLAGFMWLDKLGLAAQLGVSLVIRQSFYGGSYSLIDRQLQPLPDYWLSLLYKTLVDVQVLKTEVLDDIKDVRVYSHCTNTKRTRYIRGAITVFALNVGSTSADLQLSATLAGLPKDQYLLTPHGKMGLKSKRVALNGRMLSLVEDRRLPSLSPVHLLPRQPIILPPTSFAFYVIPSAQAPACLHT